MDILPNQNGKESFEEEALTVPKGVLLYEIHGLCFSAPRKISQDTLLNLHQKTEDPYPENEECAPLLTLPAPTTLNSWCGISGTTSGGYCCPVSERSTGDGKSGFHELVDLSRIF